jgi:hypothetical protein
VLNATSGDANDVPNVRPRRLVHQGNIRASAFLFDTSLLSLKEVRRRVLGCWSPGARVFRLPEGLLIIVTQPVPVITAEVTGIPLVARNRAYLAGPLTAAEWDALIRHPDFNASRETVILIRGGVAVPIGLADLPTEDPSQYLEMAETHTVSVSSLGEPPAPPRAPTTVTFDPHSQLGGIALPPSERDDVLRALRAAENRPASPRSSNPTPQDDSLGGIINRFFRNVFGRGQDGNVGHSASEPGRFDQLFENAAQALSFRSLVDNIGKQQADYIRKTIEMFERGNLEDALRHAIPLGKGDDGDDEDKPPFLGVPSPRDALNISPQDVPASSSFTFMPSLYDEMRRLYREAFDRLVGAGRIEEAAFVLAELLKENEEAVAFLERHGRLKLAAEMAEARRLPPGQVVRLWFLAGDPERAIRIARRMKAFSDAVLRLERGIGAQKERAAELRLIWARELAEAGDYAAAIEAALPVAAARSEVFDWMDRVIVMGGIPAVRMMARKFALAPELSEDIRTQGLKLLTDTSEARCREREAFLESLTRQEFREGHPALPGARLLARAGVRALYRDIATVPSDTFFTGPLRETQTANQLLARLQQLANDGPLRTDAPQPARRTQPESLEERAELLTIHIAENDVGALPLTDAVWLPDGRLLAALGEAGLRLVAPDGRTLLHWSQPTHRIVLADSGTVAITVAPRGDSVQRLGRLDIGRRTLKDWCDAPISAYAPNYDGSLWFVQSGDALLAVDVSAPDFFALWRMPDLGAQATSIARDTEYLSVALSYPPRKDEQGVPIPTINRESASLCFDLPELTLQGDETLIDWHNSEGQPIRLDLQITPNSTVVQQTILWLPDTGEQELYLWNHFEDRSFGEVTVPRNNQGRPVALPLAASDDTIAFAIPDLSGMTCSILDQQMDVLAEIHLAWADRVSLHLGPSASGNSEVLTIADNRGRILALDVDTGAILANVRLR